MTPAVKVDSLDPKGDLSFTMTILIKDSDVAVECELNRDLKDRELVFLHLHAFKIARSFVDLVARRSEFVSMEGFSGERQSISI